MQLFKYEYKSDFAKQYVAEGRAAIILMQLAKRFGELPQRVQARISKASIKELDAIGERLLDAKTLQEALRRR